MFCQKTRNVSRKAMAVSIRPLFIKKKVFGFQYHLENTLSIIKDLVENCRGEMVPGVYVQTPEELLAHPEYIEQK